MVTVDWRPPNRRKDPLRARVSGNRCNVCMKECEWIKGGHTYGLLAVIFILLNFRKIDEIQFMIYVINLKLSLHCWPPYPGLKAKLSFTVDIYSLLKQNVKSCNANRRRQRKQPKKISRSNWQKTNFARAEPFFCTFLCRCFARLQRETSRNFLVTRFMEEMLYVVLFTFFPLPLIFTLTTTSISHFLTICRRNARVLELQNFTPAYKMGWT